MLDASWILEGSGFSAQKQKTFTQNPIEGVHAHALVSHCRVSKSSALTVSLFVGWLERLKPPATTRYFLPVILCVTTPHAWLLRVVGRRFNRVH